MNFFYGEFGIDCDEKLLESCILAVSFDSLYAFFTKLKVGKE